MTNVPVKVNTFNTVYDIIHAFIVNNSKPILKPEDIHVEDLVNVECYICQFKLVPEGPNDVKK